MVEYLTRDRRAVGSSLTGVTALWSLSKTHLSQLSTGSTQEDPSRITERLLSGRKESNQTKKHFHCSYIMSYEYAKFEENPCVGTDESTPFEPIPDFMVVLVTCKNKEEPIKNEGARVVTRFSPL